MTGAHPVLEFLDVSRSFASHRGRVDVLRHVHFNLERGEFVAVTGSSGSGKTTLLHLAALLDRPTSGRIRFDGEDIGSCGPEDLAHRRKRGIGMVYQQFHLLPHRTVRENVLFRFRYMDHDIEEARIATRRVLAQMGLRHVADQPVRLLSGGEMQRVAIARAVVVPPTLLLADEPTGNLDGHSANSVMACFRDLNDRGHTILLATHNEALLSYCTRHVQCNDGTLAEAAAVP